MLVGNLIIAFDADTSKKAVRHIVDEIASFALEIGAVDAVKCDVAELDGTGEAEFWREAHEV